MNERASEDPAGGDFMDEHMVLRRYNISQSYLFHWVGEHDAFPAPSLKDGQPFWQLGVLEVWEEEFRPVIKSRH